MRRHVAGATLTPAAPTCGSRRVPTDCACAHRVCDSANTMVTAAFTITAVYTAYNTSYVPHCHLGGLCWRCVF